MSNPYVVGRVIALVAAIFYGFNTTLSRLAYDAGTTPVSLLLYRFLITSAAMVAIMLLLRKSWKMKVSPWVFTICVAGMYITSIGHLGAVKYIPVSLAAIIFYTFPLLVIAWKRFANHQPVNRYELSGSLGATTFILSYERFPNKQAQSVRSFTQTTIDINGL